MPLATAASKNELQRELHLPREIQLIIADAAVTVTRTRVSSRRSVGPLSHRGVRIRSAWTTKDWRIGNVECFGFEAHCQSLPQPKILRHR